MNKKIIFIFIALVTAALSGCSKKIVYVYDLVNVIDDNKPDLAVKDRDGGGKIVNIEDLEMIIPNGIADKDGIAFMIVIRNNSNYWYGINTDNYRIVDAKGKEFFINSKSTKQITLGPKETVELRPEFSFKGNLEDYTLYIGGITNLDIRKEIAFKLKYKKGIGHVGP